MRPDVGDHLYIGRCGGDVAEAFRRTPAGDLSDITGEVAGVDSDAESFTVRGKPAILGAQPWEVTCDRDAESSDAMLRGVVRASSLAWQAEARQRVEANIRRYGISKREREVCWLLFTLWTGRDVGEELLITEQTVKNHISSINRKLRLPTDRVHRSCIILRLLDLEGLSD